MSTAPFRHLVLVTILGVLSVCARAETNVVVDPSVRYQTFEGWGVSLCWWAKVVGSFPEEKRIDYMDKVFDPVKGLGFNVVRYNIGGGEDPAHDKLPLRADMEGFETSPGKWNWDADAGQRWVLQQAKARGANLFEAFSNSPPYWMTVSGSATGEKDGHENLGPARYQDFAEYLATVVQHFQDKEGITFRTLEPLNEPQSWWWRQGNRQEGCHFDPAAQAGIIEAIGRALADRHSTTRVSAPDENSINQTVDSVRAYPPAALAMISQINTHSYSGEKRRELCRLAASEHKILWQSEYGDGDASGLSLSNTILKDMHEMRPAAWIYWQAVDGAKWGLLTNAVDGSVTRPQMGKKYWVMANYSRYIHPGSVFLETGHDHSLAALDAKQSRLTVVTTNPDDREEKVTFDFSRFNTIRTTVMAVRTSATDDLAPVRGLDLHDGHLEARLPGKSVTTFVLSDVAVKNHGARDGFHKY